MKITGIITEYNPFHLGHKFHLDNCKKDTNCDGVICIMSGNFVQRGLPAITDKWSRANMAVEAGVDLVLELPTLFATASAEYFAFGSVSILDSLNIVDSIYFGSEVGSMPLIKEVSQILAFEPADFKHILSENLKLGLPFPKARANALEEYIKEYSSKDLDLTMLNTFLSSSNNILALEYCKNLLRIGSNITPLTLKREGSLYNDKETKENKFASATAIRDNIYKNNSLYHIKEFLPNYTYNILNSKKYFPDVNEMFNFIKYNLTLYPSLISNITDATEGLDNKILNEISRSNSFDKLINNCKSKRYTYTRISRVLSHVYLGITNNLYGLINQQPEYIRVLALNSTGAKILKEIKNASDVNIITKVPRKISDPLLALDIKATNLYSLLNKDLEMSSDYLKSPIIKKDF